MPSRRKSTLPPGNDHELYRQTLLWRVSEPDLLAALRWANEALYDRLNEQGQFGYETGESGTVSGIRGALADLRGVADFFDSIAFEMEASTLEAEDARLAVRSEEWAAQCRELATSIEGRLGPAPEPGDGK